MSFCGKIRRAHTVLARFKMQDKQNFLKKKFSVSLEKDFIFRFHIYFFASFASYFLVSYTESQTSVRNSFDIETVNSGANPPL